MAGIRDNYFIEETSDMVEVLVKAKIVVDVQGSMDTEWDEVKIPEGPNYITTEPHEDEQQKTTEVEETAIIPT